MLSVKDKKAKAFKEYQKFDGAAAIRGATSMSAKKKQPAEKKEQPNG